MTKPVRLQLSRARGFNLQAASRAVNGQPAITVARPGKWGNPFHISDRMSQEQAVSAFNRMMQAGGAGKAYPPLAEIVAELRGKNLACWCKAGTGCHADLLLKLANHKGASRKS